MRDATRQARSTHPPLPAPELDGQEPWRRMWLGVIRLAFRDLDASSITVREDARRFLGDNDGDLSVVARLAGLSPARVREEARQALGRA